MKNLIHTAVITLFAASAAHAQQAVQWKVSEGGNGHWYEGRRLSAQSYISWNYARGQALQRGGDLVSLRTPQEAAWVFENVANDSSLWSLSTGPWVGGFQSAVAAEPAGGWSWLDGSVLYDGFPWGVFQPDNATYCGGPGGAPENYVCYWFGEGVPTPANRFADLVESGYCVARAENDWVTSAVIEWSADCNNDGIVDYGQCRDGSLPDYDGDNVPDCCEQGVPCVTGAFPVEWRVEDGGNGHWYDQRVWVGPATITEINAWYVANINGHAVTLNSAAEDEFVYRNINLRPAGSMPAGYSILGGFQDTTVTDYSEPSGGWRWLTGEPMNYTNWGPGHPDNCCGGESVLQYPADAGWNDAETAGVPAGHRYRVIVEWDSDCNHDGIVDYGQILTGQLADLNGNGIPDICEQSTCHDADLYRNNRIDGADLGILLSEWGPVTPSTNSDINKDGFVNGADLGILLSFWGACP